MMDYNNCHVICCENGCDLCNKNPIDIVFGNNDTTTFKLRWEFTKHPFEMCSPLGDLKNVNKTRFIEAIQAAMRDMLAMYKELDFDDHQIKLVVTNKDNRKLLYSGFRPKYDAKCKEYTCIVCLDRVQDELKTYTCGHSEHAKCFQNKCSRCDPNDTYAIELQLE
jgi:hypothetical protein